MAFPLAPVVDTFNRTENPLSNGGKWGSHVQSGEANLQCDGVSAFSTSGYGSEVWLTTTTPPLDTAITRRDATADIYYVWNLQVGTENGATMDCYMLHSQGGTTDVQINRVDNGVTTQLTAISGTTNANGDQWGVRYGSDGLITPHLNGVAFGSASDATYLTAGYTGVILNSTGSGGFDNFVLGGGITGGVDAVDFSQFPKATLRAVLA